MDGKKIMNHNLIEFEKNGVFDHCSMVAEK